MPWQPTQLPKWEEKPKPQWATQESPKLSNSHSLSRLTNNSNSTFSLVQRDLAPHNSATKPTTVSTEVPLQASSKILVEAHSFHSTMETTNDDFTVHCELVGIICDYFPFVMSWKVIKV